MEKKNRGGGSPQTSDCRGLQDDAFYYPLEQEPDTEKVKKSLLLHSCCGPCSTACIERVLSDYQVTVFYFNPCITDPEEYERRKAAQVQFLQEYNKGLDQEEQIGFIEGDYEPESFLRMTEGYEKEPEGGARCTLCFQQRLEETASLAEKEGFFCFGTTLTVSPHKNYPLISAIGNQLAREHHVEFLDLDFKKKAGFQRSIELSKEYGLYRQNYCGCIYSARTGKPKK
ncbi:MAG: epoxyqueuosine reductase QueH [Firmicutes bacterium]|nr:epoxyqueuosine reductase QueH [Bacillota bacterium]MDD7601198.1 epoxyqueuosine reductase QueH [Bacillota bacterium]MDY5857419.1 epoxyqueuosine reductase QueH [Anaerovoracaceae bacterium]